MADRKMKAAAAPCCVLMNLTKNHWDVFELILRFLTDTPQHFISLAQTCDGFYQVFQPDNETTWQFFLQEHRKLFTEQEMPSHEEDIPYEWNDVDSFSPKPYNLAFLDDERLFTTFEEIMMGRVFERMKREKDSVDIILLTEIEKMDDSEESNGVLGWDKSVSAFHRLWLLPLQNLHSRDRPCLRKVEYRQDFVKAFAMLIEANIIDVLERAQCLSIRCSAASNNMMYPMLRGVDISNVLWLNSPYTHPPVGRDPVNEHSSVDFDTPFITLSDPTIRRLALRSGVAKMPHDAMNYIRRITTHLSSYLFYFLKIGRLRNPSVSTEHLLNGHHLQSFRPKQQNSEVWVPVPRDLENAAKSMGLRITTVFDDNMNGKEYFKDMELTVKKQWKTWTREEREQFRQGDVEITSNDNNPDFDFDMDLDLDDYDTDSFHCGSESSSCDNESEDDSSCSSFSLYQSDYTLDSRDEISDDDDSQT